VTGHRARKRFGQNFLHDACVVDRIVAAIDPRPGDRLLEIGPGLGAITLPLLEVAGELHVLELDRDLIGPLRARCAGAGILHVQQGDALKFDLATLSQDPASLRVVGNLPYNISTPLIFHLMRQRRLLVDLLFMLQKEVVDRMAAVPGSRSYGRLSVMTQYGCRVQPLFDIGPSSFRPRPKVQSTLVRLVPHRVLPAAADNESVLQSLVRQAFSQRRKTLRNVLRPLLAAGELEALEIDPGARAETLSLHQFVSLANYLTSARS
jgi:16S rRNA (adenine1518-N6/adenine1519-N6)-dimethyltransferase